MINKLENILLLCYKHKITAYEIEKHTGLTASGVQNILDKKVKKPHQKTLDTILDYIQSKIRDTSKVETLLNEEPEDYITRSIEDKIADAVEKRLKPYFDDLKKTKNK